MKENKLAYQLKDKAIWVVFLVLVIAFTIANPRFINPTNLFTMIRQVSFYGIASIGMTFVILLGDIDLSTGTIISFVNIICAYFMVNMGMPMVVAIILTLAIATLIGVLNGFMVSTIGIPALIATFATQTSFLGLTYIICGGLPINGFTESFKVIGQAYVWIIPVPVIIMAICFAVGSFILNKTYFGRYFYAVGGNEKATQLSGINTNKVYFIAYANMGMLAGLCALLCLARVGSVNGSTGTSFEMDAIGSCFIGGASAYGGSGTVPGVIIGALLLGVINMGMSIMGIGDSWQYVVKGGVLLVAVIFDVVSNRKGGK